MTRLLSLASIAAILLWSAAVQAAEDVLHLVPRQALGFVVVRHLADTDAKIKTLAEQVGAPMDNTPLAQFKKSTGLSKGLDEKGDAVLISMPLKDADKEAKDADFYADDKPLEPPGMVLLLPVTDYQQFLAPLHPATPKGKITEVTLMEKNFLAANQGSYALLTTLDQRDVLQAVLDSKHSIDADLADFQPWLSENDIAAVATRRLIQMPIGKGLYEVRQGKKMFSNIGGPAGAGGPDPDDDGRL